MDRSDKIVRMVNSVEGWDPQAVIDYLQEWLEHSFGDMTDEQIDEEYNKWFGEEDANLPHKCTCDLITLMGSGCLCGGQ